MALVSALVVSAAYAAGPGLGFHSTLHLGMYAGATCGYLVGFARRLVSGSFRVFQGFLGGACVFCKSLAEAPAAALVSAVVVSAAYAAGPDLG